jgi:hypothetical protein
MPGFLAPHVTTGIRGQRRPVLHRRVHGTRMRIMATAYERDDNRRLITVTITEPYAVEDVCAVIDRQVAEDTWEYAMLYDLHVPIAVEADSQHIADHIRIVGGGRARGPVGIAIRATPEQFRRGLVYSEITRKLETVEVLLTPAQREDWLARNAPKRK